MHLKIFFEKDETELAFNLIDAYEHFLNYNETIPDDFRLMNLNFLKYYEDLLKIKEGSQKFSKVALLNKINGTKNLSYHGWLVNSLKNLKVRR